MFKLYFAHLAFSLCILDCGFASPVDDASMKWPPTTSGNSEPVESKKVEDKHAAPVGEQDSARIHHIGGTGLGGHRPPYNPSVNPNAHSPSITYGRPIPHPQPNPYVQPVSYFKPSYSPQGSVAHNVPAAATIQFVPSALKAPQQVAVPSARPTVPHLSLAPASAFPQAAYTKPVVSYGQQYGQKPTYPIAQQIIHKPFVTEQVQVIRIPLISEIHQVVHKPILTEVQQVIRHPLYTQHVVKKPSYNAVKQEVQGAPLHLNSQQYHVITKPEQQFIQLPAQQLQSAVHTSVASRPTQTVNAVRIPAASVPTFLSSAYGYGSYVGANQYDSSYFSPYTCRAGECDIKNDSDGRDVVVPSSSSFMNSQPTSVSFSDLPDTMYSNYKTFQPLLHAIAVPYPDPFLFYDYRQTPVGNFEKPSQGRRDNEFVDSEMSNDDNLYIDQDMFKKMARTLLGNDVVAKIVDDTIMSDTTRDNNARDASQNEKIKNMLEKIQSFDENTRLSLLEEIIKKLSTNNPSPVNGDDKTEKPDAKSTKTN